MTTLNTIIEEEKVWKCIGHTEYGDKISLDGHSYIKVPTDYIKQVRMEERAKIREEVIEILKAELPEIDEILAKPTTTRGKRKLQARHVGEYYGIKRAIALLAKLTPDKTP